jgi:AraC family transcriptional regulator of adaptative response/methylated-DNA-[protein]-cysteine methyltransferase
MSPDDRLALVTRVCRMIEGAEAPPRLGDLAEEVGLSPHHLHRVFKAVTGVTPKAYAVATRAARARDGLEAGARVTDALYDAGFASTGRFYEDAPGRLGMTPTQYRAGGSDVTVQFAVGACSLGAILVAATDRGVCAIELGDDPDVLVRALQDRFHAADLVGGDQGFEAVVARAVALVEHPELPGVAADLPLDVRGTAFQERVWQALRAIPAGETRTYAEIARAIGAPSSVRAVAGACGANHVAVAIPCHRVVRSDGSLSGYRWGVERKAALLAREAAVVD